MKTDSMSYVERMTGALWLMSVVRDIDSGHDVRLYWEEEQALKAFLADYDRWKMQEGRE